MSVLIKNTTILDPSSAFNNQKVDVLVEKGKIVKIGSGMDEAAEKVITGESLHLSAGWVDVMADYCEPGYEQKETIRTGLDAAAAGGFTEVLLVPNTQPAISTQSVVEFVHKKAFGHDIRLHVMGSISKNIEGEKLAEMLDMHHAGAIAFTDGWTPVQDAGLMLKALEYVKTFDGVLVQVPIHEALSKDGFMNEGVVSLKLGMGGVPKMAESLMVHRDIQLVRYTDSKIHFSGLSTGESLDLVKKAKKEGLKVSCSVTPYHLLFSDEILSDYDSVYKVNPPLRTEKERQEVIGYLKDGTVDCIATHHRPQEWDAKTKEFEYAAYGMVGQETAWPMLLAAVPDLSMERWTELLSLNARRIFNLGVPTIEVGKPAELTLFDRESEWSYRRDSKKTLAQNTPWLDQTLTGRATAVMVL